jgi:MFS family permease
LAGFYASLFLSRLGDQVLLFLVPLVVFQLTGSAAWSGLAFFVETLPRFLACAVCGALCDRIAPLTLLHLSQRWRALACSVGLLAWLAPGVVALQLGVLVLVSAVCGVLTVQGLMAREVMLPQIYAGGRFEVALAHTQLADQLGMVLGPLVAALALQWLDWPWVVGLTAALFALADSALAHWQRHSTVRFAPPQDAALAGGPWLVPLRHSIGTALALVWRLPGLKALIVLAAGENLVIGVTAATSAAVVTGLLAQSAAQYAWLQTAGAVATVLVLLLIARTAMPLPLLAGLSFGCILVGAVLTALSPLASQGMLTYTLGFLLVTGFDKMFSVYIRSRRQKIIPPGDLGKTTGVIVLLNNLTQPLAGLLVAAWAVRMPVTHIIAALTAVMALLGAAVWFSGRVSARAETRRPTL